MAQRFVHIVRSTSAHDYPTPSSRTRGKLEAGAVLELASATDEDFWFAVVHEGTRAYVLKEHGVVSEEREWSEEKLDAHVKEKLDDGAATPFRIVFWWSVKWGFWVGAAFALAFGLYQGVFMGFISWIVYWFLSFPFLFVGRWLYLEWRRPQAW